MIDKKHNKQATPCIADRRQCKPAEKASPQQMCIILHGQLAAFLQGAKKYNCKISENVHFQVCQFAMPPLGGIAENYNIGA